MSARTGTSRGSRRITAIILIVVLLVAGVLSYTYWSGTRLSSQYEAFIAAELRFEDAAYKPGAEANPIRQQVNLLLAEVLQVEMTTTERLEKSRQGIAHLNDMETQIDGIKDEGDKVMPLRADLEKAASSPGNISKRSSILEVVTLAKRQAEIIADIRGLSYRTDYYTTEVFERVIDDQGLMTDEHKQYLNDIIPQLEEQFNKRTNLYAELTKNAARMKQIAGDLGVPAQ